MTQIQKTILSLFCKGGYKEDIERIVFNGDGYSEAWEKDAAPRGLSNLAYPVYTHTH